MMDLSYVPEKIVDTESITRKEWLEYRRKGIGGSDAAVIFNASKWKSRRELYFDKRGYFSDEEPENWFSLDAGNMMEPLIRKLFSKKTGFEVFKDTWQYRHPLYPFMLADADFFFYDQDGNLCGGEIKTTDPSNLDQWNPGIVGREGRIPVNYEFQVRHYMCVFNLERWDVICSYGYSADKSIIVTVYRDLEFEEILIEEEKLFWENHIMTGIPPMEFSISDRAVKRLRNLVSPPSKRTKGISVVELDGSLVKSANDFISKYAEMNELKKKADEIKEELNALSIPFTDAIGECDKGALFIPGNEEEAFEVSFARQFRTGVDKDKLILVYPDIYEELKTESETRPFSIKKKKIAAVRKLLK